MTRQHDTTGDSDATRDGARWLPFVEAAGALGVTLRTIQRRAASGELPSRDGHGGRVVLVKAPIATEAATRRDSDATTRHHDATRDSGHDNGGKVEAELRDALEREREQVKFLRGLVEARDRDAAELRAALRKALDNASRALPAPDGHATATPPSNASSAPTTVPDVAAALVPETPTAAPQRAARKPDTRPLWARLIGYRPKA